MGDVGLEPAVTGGRWTRRHLVLATAAAVIGVVVAMAWTGWGTGPGPLAPPELGRNTARVEIPAMVGSVVSDAGAFGLHNRGRFDAHLERVRPIPVDAATKGMPVESVRLAHPTEHRSGDDTWWEPGQETTAEGFTFPRGRPDDDPGSWMNLVVRFRLAEEGLWTYRGYEVTYRSGLVRHRMVLPLEFVGCAPARGRTGCS